LYARNVIVIEDHDSLLNNPDLAAEARENIKAGDCYVLKNAVSRYYCRQMREYLTLIGRNSLANYHAIAEGCPNFHRINRWDPRAYVKGCFHQFSFFPWNQDPLNLFEKTKNVYHVKNLMTGVPKEKFLGAKPDEGCTARLSFQFYPKGTGGLNKHEDPVDYHQVSATIMTMSVKGEDFFEGGSYVEKENGELVMLDDITGPGDVIHTNAQVNHGVLPIDPHTKEDWLSFEGRWMLLFAINKVAGNTAIREAKDLGSK
jgi:hypothetical protein